MPDHVSVHPRLKWQWQLDGSLARLQIKGSEGLLLMDIMGKEDLINERSSVGVILSEILHANMYTYLYANDLGAY